MLEPRYYNMRGKDVEFQPSGELYVYQSIGEWNLRHAKPGDVGLDLPVRIKGMEHAKPPIQVYPHCDYYINYQEAWVDIPALGYAELPSGLHIKLPDDAWGLIKARSSTGWKKRLNVVEGTIDSQFVGALCCLVFNPNTKPIRVHHEERLAQLILIPKYPLKSIIYCDKLPETIRGDTGFGSSGN